MPWSAIRYIICLAWFPESVGRAAEVSSLLVSHVWNIFRPLPIKFGLVKLYFFSNKSLAEHLWWCHYTEFMLCGYNCLLKQRNLLKCSISKNLFATSSNLTNCLILFDTVTVVHSVAQVYVNTFLPCLPVSWFKQIWYSCIFPMCCFKVNHMPLPAGRFLVPTARKIPTDAGRYTFSAWACVNA